MEHFAYQPERCYFNPRTPRGVRLEHDYRMDEMAYRISIHAPREGCDRI